MASRLAVSFGCTPVREIHRSTEEQSIAETIVDAIAELDGVEPTDLPPLYDSVDPDAMDRLFEHRRLDSSSPMALCFTYHGWNVFVRGDGSIVVGDPDRMTEQTPLF